MHPYSMVLRVLVALCSSRYVRLESGGQRDQCAHHPCIFQEPRGDRRSHREEASIGNDPAQTIPLTERLDVCRLAGSNVHKYSCHAAHYAMTRLTTTLTAPLTVMKKLHIGTGIPTWAAHIPPCPQRTSDVHGASPTHALVHVNAIQFSSVEAGTAGDPIRTARSKYAPSDSSPRQVSSCLRGLGRRMMKWCVCICNGERLYAHITD